MPTISIIAAMTEDRVIGRNNQLPWHLSEDLKRFKSITMGHPIIMGRKTYESIGRPLPGRDNYVVTANEAFHADGVVVTHGLEDAYKHALKGNEEIFVIGGATLFEQILPRATKLYFTIIHEKIPGDVFFPQVDFKDEFKIVEESRHQSPQGEKLNYSFLTAVRHGHR